jgi:glycerophosphoryl diester phosphodiesterase
VNSDEPSGCLVIAHRGASSYAPENTFAAFDLALRMGVSHIELDVHSTRDGHIVVIHDETVDRTTNGHGPVMSHSLAALTALDAGAWFEGRNETGGVNLQSLILSPLTLPSPPGGERVSFAGERIPRFADVLERYKGRTHIHTEIKGHGDHLSERTVDLVRRHGMVDQVTITSFQRARLAETRAYAPELPTGWLVGEITDVIVTEARAMGLTQLCPRASTVTAELVHRLHADGFIVRAWGVSTEELMRQVVKAGADGMTVNFPDKLLSYLSIPGRP